MCEEVNCERRFYNVIKYSVKGWVPLASHSKLSILILFCDGMLMGWMMLIPAEVGSTTDIESALARYSIAINIK